jgi:hypothetical protein
MGTRYDSLLKGGDVQLPLSHGLKRNAKTPLGLTRNTLRALAQSHKRGKVTAASKAKAAGKGKTAAGESRKRDKRSRKGKSSKKSRKDSKSKKSRASRKCGKDAKKKSASQVPLAFCQHGTEGCPIPSTFVQSSSDLPAAGEESKADFEA